MYFIYLAFSLKVNFSQLIKMLNGKKMIIGIYSCSYSVIGTVEPFCLVLTTVDLLVYMHC